LIEAMVAVAVTIIGLSSALQFLLVSVRVQAETRVRFQRSVAAWNETRSLRSFPRSEGGSTSTIGLSRRPIQRFLVTWDEGENSRTWEILCDR